MSEAPKKKSSALKWILGGCLTLVVLGAVGIGLVIYAVSQAISTDPAKVEEMAQEMFPMKTPAGMTGQMGMNMMGLSMASFGSTGDVGMGKALILMTFPSGTTSPEEMKRQMKEQMAQQGQKQEQGAQVEQKVETFMLRGEEIEGQITIFEQGEGENVDRNAQIMIVVEGTGGKPVLVMFMGPESEVTQEYVQSNLDTVK